MTEVCTQCFSDLALKEAVQFKGGLGECSFCRVTTNVVVEVEKLTDLFEPTTECLIESEDGVSPVEIYSSAFNLFNDCMRDPEGLLALVLDEEFLSKKYVLPDEVAKQGGEWGRFKEELKHGNRYFPQYAEYRGLFSRRGDDYGIFGDLVSQLQVTYRVGNSFYRSRLSEDDLDASKMGRPQAKKTSNGRANPAGISYLYVSEDKDTAVKEVRPSIGGTVFIAELKVKEDFRVIDLTSPRVMASVLKFEGERMLPALKFLNLLDSFSQDLSNPVVPERSHLEYVPTQFVCEFLKNIADFNGIRYASSYGSFANLVLFDDRKLEVREPVKNIVTGASIDYQIKG